MKKDIHFVFSDASGKILDHPGAGLAGRSWNSMVQPGTEELIPLPDGSKFFLLPHTVPLAWDPQHHYAREFPRINGKKVGGVAAFLPPAYTRTLLPAARPLAGYRTLPLWAYTAVGWYNNRFWVPAIRVDAGTTWDPRFYDDRKMKPRLRNMLKEFPRNRLVRHLAHCATGYHCFNAKNLFFRRWEMPLPTSPACNAGCRGCISHQARGACKASMHRITFVPTPKEIVEIAVPHLEEGDGAIASFGQGCEGEPLLQADLIEKAIKNIRQQTGRGTLHLNTNGSVPPAIRKLCRAGLDSVRFSLNSVQPDFYHTYFRPQGYTFRDVMKSMAVAKGEGKYVSLNLFVFPGLTDREEEAAGLYKLIEKTGIDLVQFRNLNIDPELYMGTLPAPRGECRGIYRFIAQLKKDFPRLQTGYFNRPKEKFYQPLSGR